MRPFGSGYFLNAGILWESFPPLLFSGGNANHHDRERIVMAIPHGIDHWNARHGLCGTSLYARWNQMVMRCHNPNTKCYPRYGGRGITVCERWRDFSNFFADMGHPPTPKHSLERIDNGGRYEPSNCRWATLSEQCRNRRSNVILTHNGESMTATDWAIRLGLDSKLLFARVDAGWSTERILFEPVRDWSKRPRK